MRTGKAALYEDLKRLILTMELDPDALLDEASLTAQYGLSRTPVREVFQRLAGEGYLEIVEKRGVRVIPMSHATLRNFFLVAPMIYAAVGRLAVQHYKPVQLKALKEAQKRFRKAVQNQDADALALENNRFHEIMGEMAANPYLQPSLGRLLIDHCRIGHTFFRPQNEDMERRLLLAADHHDAFIAALEARDEQTVVDLVFEHWELSRENMEIFIAPQGLKADERV
ncbi:MULTISPECIES: GntR family transcriptional regulator [Enterobacter]|jgi:DNA-binding GntR family transcriptional regulator|uniref:GntR family transcriptional regulator n=1 Tax=Enterobacter cancerogenus TaxID=69218 RepID=A0AB38P8S4_9ENTR|nr:MULTISPECIES: GntR family transcriptional regulator [Enterobacter]AUJ82151.1 GntR family transcriptional regulator [Enterobacter cancerogenus]EFC58115.1 transcriptional regulator, GntR family [Enterobacter cancerogenus ATCC 35316]EKS7429084.1 GntR family transcriptional regulator [Enterobacter cancerogenus]KTQ46211.1 GntR family transcriptional regulator [Enterobacter cancerogenus]KTQ49684.1 GntR family transcriptional regulator [Enterobacter cancerogenus]